MTLFKGLRAQQKLKVPDISGKHAKKSLFPTVFQLHIQGAPEQSQRKRS